MGDRLVTFFGGFLSSSAYAIHKQLLLITTPELTNVIILGFAGGLSGYLAKKTGELIIHSVKVYYRAWRYKRWRKKHA